MFTNILLIILIVLLIYNISYKIDFEYFCEGMIKICNFIIKHTQNIKMYYTSKLQKKKEDSE